MPCPRYAQPIPATARPREPSVRPLGARRLIADEAVNRRGVAPLLPQARFRAPAQLAHARPVRIVGNEGRVTAEIRGTVRVSQDEPFDEFLRGGLSDGFFDRGRVAGLGLAHQIDGLFYRREIAGQWRRFRNLGRCFDRWFRLTPHRCSMHRVLCFLERGVAVRPGLTGRICLFGMLNRLGASECQRIIRKRGEHGQGGKTSQRPEALVHSVILREPAGTSHEIARSVRLERYERYHIAESQLSRIRNIGRKTEAQWNPKRVKKGLINHRNLLSNAISVSRSRASSGARVSLVTASA
jgi:hypothetical protein